MFPDEGPPQVRSSGDLPPSRLVLARLILLRMEEAVRRHGDRILGVVVDARAGAVFAEPNRELRRGGLQAVGPGSEVLDVTRVRPQLPTTRVDRAAATRLAPAQRLGRRSGQNRARR
jgi:hypothetical protein